jgi:tetratricopeptide (TPR) repeat protein
MKTFAVCLLAATALTAAKASQDPSIDHLLGKLPPPEKFVDPAINDPLAKHLIAAAKSHNFGIALDDSRHLAQRYPKSVGAQVIHAQVALALHMYPESSEAFHKVLSFRPDYVDGYFGLGMTELSQRHFRAALGDFQQVARLIPDKDLGWVAMSVCEEKLGDKKNSLDYARKATAIAPNSWVAWMQAAREENLAGNKQAAVVDLVRASNLRKTAAKPTKKA